MHDFRPITTTAQALRLKIALDKRQAKNVKKTSQAQQFHAAQASGGSQHTDVNNGRSACGRRSTVVMEICTIQLTC